jgi:hypothetical protein
LESPSCHLRYRQQVRSRRLPILAKFVGQIGKIAKKENKAILDSKTACGKVAEKMGQR